MKHTVTEAKNSLMYTVVEFLIDHDPRKLVGTDPQALEQLADDLDVLGFKETAEKVRNYHPMRQRNY